MHLFIPKVRLKSYQHPKWFNSDIRHHLNCLRTLRRKLRIHPSEHIKSRIDSSEEALKEKMSSAKSMFETELIKSFGPRNPSRIYKYIDEITGHNTIPITVNYESTSASSDLEKASLFNLHFHSVFTQSSFILPPISDLPTPQYICSDIVITEDEVLQVLSSLDPSKAAGYDKIGPKLLKHCALALYQPLHHLFCLSLQQSYIPDEWRMHLISPIFKSGDKSLVNNYRPISLLCVISKVLERLIFKHLLDFASSSLSSTQFGFRQKHSTLQQMLVFLNNVYDTIKNNSQTDVVYLDFRKAFDSVAHNELLFKLWSFGITGNLWSWIKAYLTQRLQCASINNSVSSPLPVVSGVPQGSILGPLLFLIFVNDLPASVSSSHLFLFADDTKCAHPISSVSDCLSLQSDLDQLSSWSSDWSLHFNEDKCAIVRYSTRQNPIVFNYHINGKQLVTKMIHKDLGVLISDNLVWKEHYDHLLKRAYKTLNLLRRIFHNVRCVQAKKVLYFSLVHSQLLYCSPIWRPHFIRDIIAIENIQRRATKFILNDYSSDYKYRLITLNLLPLMMQFELQDLLFFLKNHKEPSTSFDIKNYVQFCSSNTRSFTHLKMKQPFLKLNCVRHFYFNRLPRLWNSIPPIDLDQSLSSIKHTLHTYFWDHFLNNFHSDMPCTFHCVCPCAKCSILPVSYNFNTFVTS